MKTVSDTQPVRRRYERLAGQYDRRWQPYIDATLEEVLRALPCDGSSQLLDVPCGTGELARRLLTRGQQVRYTGADLSHTMLRQASDKIEPGQATWIEANVSCLPFGDAAFDTVVCANSFHYFRSPLQSAQELRRVLRPGGQLILVDWCDDYLMCKLCSIWLRFTDAAFFRTYSLDACRALLEQAGFHVTDAKRFRVGWLWGMMRLISRAGG